MSAEREAEIESCFSCRVDFHFLNELETFNDLLDEFELRSNTAKAKALDSYSSEEFLNNGAFGEGTKCDWLIVIDDVIDLADESKKFASSLTVARKFNYSCVYIFHTIYPGKGNWKTILSQTNMFDIFVNKCFVNKCTKNFRRCLYQKNKKVYSTICSLDSRIFIELGNRNDSVFLTLDCCSINKCGPARFRTDADKPVFQTCYNKVVVDEQAYNEFVSKRKNESKITDKIQFNIIHLKSKKIRKENLDATTELCNLRKNDTTTSGAEKKRAWKIFGGGSKFIEKPVREHEKRPRAKPRFPLGQ